VTALSVAERGSAITRVYAEHRRRFLLLHEVTGAAFAPCGEQVHSSRVYGQAWLDVCGLTLRWCDLCWWGQRRCVKCQAPSGDRCLCDRCGTGTVA
jgi:hypothetical protein